MKKIIFTGILLYCIGCSSQKPLIITQFYPFNKITDTTIIYAQKTRADYYLITNYQNSNITAAYIDRYVEKNMNIESAKNKVYSMYFFKETKYTNIDEIRKNPRVIDRYSYDHDLVYKYVWDEGKFEGREKIKNGEIQGIKQPKLKFTMKMLPDSVENKNP